MTRPFFDYAAPVVYPNYSPTSIQRLQLVQNRCLRLIIGAHNAASTDHLHSETEILPVGRHLHLLSSQFLASAMCPSHPSHHLVVTPPPPSHRKIKNTLRTKCWDSVSDFLQDGIIPAGRVREAQRDIHTRVVSEARESSTNRVLGTTPPSIDASEKTLPRKTRAILSQLRSGHCSRLNDFQLRIGSADSDLS